MAFLTTCVGLIKCNMGTMPVMPYIVLPTNDANGCFLPAATIKDNIPFLNILPFITCKSLMNPLTILASLRPPPIFFMFTPGPCLPITTGWKPGSPLVKIQHKKALNNTSKNMCVFGGKIQILFPGEPMFILVP